MIAVASTDHLRHDPPYEGTYGVSTPVFEVPSRAETILAALTRTALGPIVPPRAFGLDPVRAVHSAPYLAYLDGIYERWVTAGGPPAAVMPDTFAMRWMDRVPDRLLDNPFAAAGYFAFDTGAPIVAGTYGAARAAADIALTGAALLLEGHPVAYALCRPPGHHAGVDMGGGYCYLNNAAIAAHYLVHSPAPAASGAGAAPRRVAILDIDVHHGNGTQQIFYGRDDVLVVSVHADPLHSYPCFSGYAVERGTGRGLGYTLNIPLDAGTDDAGYYPALEEALQAIVATRTQVLVVSLGFDTAAGDPLGSFSLTAAAYPTIARRVAALGLPTLLVQEGGYVVETLGDNVVSFLRGFIEAQDLPVR